MVDISTCSFAPWGRSHILDTAGRLFRTYGIGAVSMDQIADACRIDPFELSAQFESKEELLQVFVAQLQVNLSASFFDFRTAENAIEVVIQTLPVKLKMIQEVQQEFLLELEADYPEIWRKMEALRDGVILDLILANLNRGRDEGLYREDLDPVLVAVQRHQDLLDFHSRSSSHGLEAEDELLTMTLEYLESITNSQGKIVLAEMDIQQLA